MMNRKVFGIRLPYLLGFLALVVILLIVLLGGTVVDIIDKAIHPDQINPDDIVVCSESGACTLWYPFLYSAVLLIGLLICFMITTLIERQFLAALQQRVGPNRVGPGGYLQPIADAVKMIFKEDIFPKQVNKVTYILAPVLKLTPVFLAGAVIPFGPDLLLPWVNGDWYRVPLSVADINVGVLWILAATSLATYGVVLAGWSSSNKYSMLGGLRATAQMISYEIAMGLAVAVPIMLADSMSVRDIVDAQSGNPLHWFIFQNPLAAGILAIALIAELNRSPFDLPEAEQELTAGFITEYSGMKFALFMMAEYVGMAVASLVFISLFLGGYHFVLVDEAPILGPIFLTIKLMLCLFGLVWVRATLPRLRYDRLMTLGWKVLLPLALLAVSWTAIAVVIGEELGTNGYTWISLVIFALVLLGWWFFGRADAVEKLGYETDSTITGERGLAYTLAELLGGLLAIPPLLYRAARRGLTRLTQLRSTSRRHPVAPTSDGAPDEEN